jgi:uncharacterized protein YcbK (DUF882 family)
MPLFARLDSTFARAAAAASTLAALCWSGTARADVTHIVQRGHTIQTIAHRYHVTEKAIIDANHLSDPKHLRPGQTLIIPGVDSKKKHGAADKHEASDGKHDLLDKHEGPDHGAPGHPVHALTAEIAPPAEPHGRAESDTIHAVRLGEEFRIRVRDAHGHVPASALKAFERLMRQGNATHPVDPRLVTLVGMVSNHFGGATIEVVSGYRAYKPTQYTSQSNHNYGKALDFRMHGVSDEALRDFCRSLRSAGCGFYPNDSFIHLDVRDAKAYWVDVSHRGEAPKYEKPGMMGDEGTSDVGEERSVEPAAAAAPAPQAPASPPAPAPQAPAPATVTPAPVPAAGPAGPALADPHESNETQPAPASSALAK